MTFCVTLFTKVTAFASLTHARVWLTLILTHKNRLEVSFGVSAKINKELEIDR